MGHSLLAIKHTKAYHTITYQTMYQTIPYQTKPYYNIPNYTVALWQLSMGHSLLTPSRPNTFIGQIRQMEAISVPSSFRQKHFYWAANCKNGFPSGIWKWTLFRRFWQFQWMILAILSWQLSDSGTDETWCFDLVPRMDEKSCTVWEVYNTRPTHPMLGECL